MNSPRDPLDDLLHEWRVEPRNDPGFRAAVRTRIGTPARAATWTGYLRTHGATVACALVLALVLGAWTGREQARDRAAAERAAVVADYVHSLDARWMRMR